MPPARTRTTGARRGAARTATLVAVPVALAVGALSLWVAGAVNAPKAGPSNPAPSVAAPTTAVRLTTRPLPPDASAVCRAVIAALPATVREHARRPVTAGPEQNAAYGEPPLTLECGVPAPTFPPTALVSGLSGVCWYARPGPSGTLWTTVDRAVPVRVSVPGPAAGSAQSVIPFSPAIAAADPPAARIPSGCNP